MQRVVAVSPDGQAVESALAGKGLEDTELVCVPTPYEAAAEMLAGGCTALVLDVSVLSKTHRPLTELAVQCGATLLGYGTVSPGASADDLHGITFTSLSQLGDRLGRSAPSASESAPPEPPGPAGPKPIEMWVPMGPADSSTPTPDDNAPFVRAAEAFLAGARGGDESNGA